jgi:phospholipid/cholesterol/gamma-HCH transport system permease protein
MPPAHTAKIDGSITGETLYVALSGDWRLDSPRPNPETVFEQIQQTPAVARVCLEAEDVGRWDSGLLVFVKTVRDYCTDRGIGFEATGLPEGAGRLFRLATSVARRESARTPQSLSLVDRVGEKAIETATGTRDIATFTGEVAVALGRVLRGGARWRARDVWLFIQETGIEALPIVSLISFLVGVILAFVGAVQLRQFGAQLYVADLVGLAMTREMGAMMTAIIMAGRTGAAYAAQLGTMTVNEEIDAFRTAGISPVEYLVMPRVIALTLMLPPLVLYADFVGIIGGAVVGVGMLDISFSQYFEQTRNALTPLGFALGLIKAFVYGALVAFAGCYQGMRCGRSAAAVGSAVTSAVVMGILLVIVASAVTTFLYNQLGV